jgi:hypothetical protein
MPLPRPCANPDCQKRFQPKHMERLCQSCYTRIRNANFIKMMNHRISMSRSRTSLSQNINLEGGNHVRKK